MSRLDRFFVSLDWEAMFRSLVNVKLRRPISDHWPILLSMEEEDWGRGPRLFRFNNAYLGHKEFMGKVREW